MCIAISLLDQVFNYMFPLVFGDVSWVTGAVGSCTEGGDAWADACIGG